MHALEDIKHHLDAHGVGCVVANGHVAISVIWTRKTPSGEERRRELIERVTTLEDACRVLGCGCGA